MTLQCCKNHNLWGMTLFSKDLISAPKLPLNTNVMGIVSHGDYEIKHKRNGLCHHLKCFKLISYMLLVYQHVELNRFHCVPLSLNRMAFLYLPENTKEIACASHLRNQMKWQK